MKQNKNKIYYQRFKVILDQPSSMVVTISFPKLERLKDRISLGTDIQYNSLEDFLDKLKTPDGLRYYKKDLPKIKKWLTGKDFIQIEEPIFDYFGETEKIKKLKFKNRTDFLKSVESWRKYAENG